MKKITSPISNDFKAFTVLAETKNFTKSAAILGVSQSRLSQIIRDMETNLGFRLVNRTTRSVSVTNEGAALIEQLRPLFEQVDSVVEGIKSSYGEVSGVIKISATNAGLDALLPKLATVLSANPNVVLEADLDYGMVDIVSKGFDAGIRNGENLPKDMIAIPLTPPVCTAIVATPDYFRRHGIPKTPQDLLRHRCINIRLPTHGGLYRWEFEQGEETIEMEVPSALITNSGAASLTAALAGIGLSYLPDQTVQYYLQVGLLQRVLDDWCEPYSGFYFFYPSKTLQRPAMELIIQALRQSLPEKSPL